MTTALMKRAHEARTKAEMDIRAILDKAADEKRATTPEEDHAIEQLDAESRQLNDRLGQLIEEHQRSADLDDTLRKFGAPADADAPEARNIEQELRELADGKRRSVHVMPEQRDLTKGSSTAGGNTVPTSFYNQLQEHMIESSGILRAGPTILNTASGENIEVPVTTSFSSGALISEGGTLTESDPAFGKRTLGAFKYGMSVQLSRELVDDTGVDLLGFLARQAGRAVGNALGVHLATGDGSSKPSGIVTTSTLGVTGATSVSGVFTADDLIDLEYSVIAPYRNSTSCAWIMRDATVAKVRKLKDTTNQYIWQPSLQVGSPDVLLGKPIYTDPNIAATATSAKSVIFGDISAYWVRLAGGVRFERSDEFAFQNDLVTFRCVIRGDGLLADQTGAVKHFIGGAS